MSPGLSSKQAQKLRQLAGSCVVGNPREAERLAQEQILRDLQATVPLLRLSIASALRRRYEIEVDAADCELRLEQLREGDWRAETNLETITGLTAKQVHDVVYQGLSAACILNVRLALM